MATHINRIGIDYPVVVETEARGDRKSSSHYRYRRKVKDNRKWGTPFYVIVDARDIEPAGAGRVFARQIHTVSGEMVEQEAEQFIEYRLQVTGDREEGFFPCSLSPITYIRRITSLTSAE
jgi:hypothetical protein